MTVWYRIKEYQIVSLTIIAEAPHQPPPYNPPRPYPY